MRYAGAERVDHDILNNRAPSVAALFRDRVRASGSADAFQYFEGKQLVHVSWAEAKERVYNWAAGLICLGVELEDRVAIASNTRYEWAIADLATTCAGAATTTVYPSTMAEDVSYIVADSGSRVVFAEDDGQIEKLRHHRHELPDVVKVVTFTGLVGEADDWVLSVDQLERLGRQALAADPNLVDARIDQIEPQHLALLIYTSGTTGRPKGAEITQDAIVYTGAAIASIGLLDKDDLQFLWLPLSHIFGKIMLTLPVQIGFPTAIDGQIDRIIEHVAVVKPTFMAAAPRIFEKAYARIASVLAQEEGVKRKLMDWALDVGRQAIDARTEGREPNPVVRAQLLVADRLVLSKVRDRFGGRVRQFISGSAKLDPDVARWFGSVGLPIMEGYGLTETSAATTVNRNDTGAFQFGTVGWAMPGTDVTLADDGEILVKGPGVMRGYRNRPEETAEAFDESGYFRTGDIGEIDDYGFITITDRKKDLFKTSGGKYIAPSQIESAFKGLCPYVSHLLVQGEGKNYATALVTLDADAITGWAATHGMEGQSYAQIASSPQALEMVQVYVDKLNAGLNRWETIKRFTILDRDLTIEEGELTPSLKLRRRAVTERFQEQIAALYD